MTNDGQGNGAPHPRIGERVDQIGANAQQIWEDARGAVHQISGTLDLKGRVERHPYAAVLAAAGIGYVLGGGLFTPLTGRMIRLGLRLAALPLVKDELMGLAEAAVDNLAGPSRSPNPGETR
jgi:hypothetical protein